MARPEKVAVVEEIRTKVAESDATVLTEYRGLKVHELAELRAALRPTGTEYKVFKNTLARRAMDGAELDGVVSLLEGPVAIAFVRGGGEGAARVRSRQPGAGREGRSARRQGARAEGDRSPRRASVAGRAAGADRGCVPGAAGEGGRPVPGLAAQPRLRREGAHRPA